MKIRFNNGLSITLITILILINVFGQVLILSYIDHLQLINNLKISTLGILITNLSSIIDYLPNLLIGIWLFTLSTNFQQERWSWFLLGLAFGEYSLIFLAILLIVQGIKFKIDLNKVFKPILILLIISIFLTAASRFLIKPYLTMNLNATDYGFFGEYKSYLSFLNLGVMILIHIILAVKLYKWIGHIQMKGKLLWSISTVFLGLLPIILFNGFTLNKIKENEPKGI
ncbi:MAG: hypothetical protein H6Q25_572 [Bacteroidetes bacterium]|nr:hypothetical protein [Bacteroidota bacterium]